MSLSTIQPNTMNATQQSLSRTQVTSDDNSSRSGPVAKNFAFRLLGQPWSKMLG